MISRDPGETFVFSCNACPQAFDTERMSKPQAYRALHREGWVEVWPSANGMMGIKEHYCSSCKARGIASEVSSVGGLK